MSPVVVRGLCKNEVDQGTQDNRQLCPSAHAFTYEDSLLFTAIFPVLGSLEARPVPGRLRSFKHTFMKSTMPWVLWLKEAQGPGQRRFFKTSQGFVAGKTLGLSTPASSKTQRRDLPKITQKLGPGPGYSTELLQGLPAPTARPGLVLHVL